MSSIKVNVSMLVCFKFRYYNFKSWLKINFKFPFWSWKTPWQFFFVIILWRKNQHVVFPNPGKFPLTNFAIKWLLPFIFKTFDNKRLKLSFYNPQNIISYCSECFSGNKSQLACSVHPNKFRKQHSFCLVLPQLVIATCD